MASFVTWIVSILQMVSDLYNDYVDFAFFICTYTSVDNILSL